ncbi:cytochrome P450 [Roseibium sp. MMSF_3544]|uniref:cytochrome P450 n=1 Tax=unclassified Roseibium TaxID=2629323 RepID=UPI00273EB17B|nr:cytochrome P450 [Roseibium sp. MMSF_3544]
MEAPLILPRKETWTDHEYVRRAAAQGPVVRDRHGIFITFSYDHMQQLVDPSLTRQMETETMALQGINSGPVFDLFNNAMLFSNGDAHKTRRGLLARSFAIPLIRRMRPEIRTLAEELVRENLDKGDIDFRDRIGGQLAARTITMVLGVPQTDIPHVTKLVYSAIRALSVRSPAVLEEATADLADLNGYVEALLEDHRSAGPDDFLGAYLDRVEDSSLTEIETRAQIVILLLAGSDTTRGALSSTVSQLLQHRTQWDMLCSDREAHLSGAVSEGLRYDPVIGALIRVADRDLVFENVSIPEGSLVGPLVVAALRDPEVYDRPDRFDITRSDHPRWHPVFGAGEHRCLGEALERAELEEALDALCRLAPKMELTGPPPTIRGLGATRSVSEMRCVLAA